MATSIFNQQNTNLNGVFTANKAKLMFGAGDLTGVLVQGINFTYAQNVARLYEVGNNGGGESCNVYYVGGRTQGQASLNRVVGPNATIKQLYASYGDVCKAKTNNLTLTLTESDCANSSNMQLSFTLKFCVLTQIGITLQAQDMIINETGQIMFSGLDYS